MMCVGKILHPAVRLSGTMLAALFVLSGCTQNSYSPENKHLITPSLAEGQPRYVVGTVFIYSNGSWDKVESTQPGTVNWINHKGSRSSGASDFTFRPAVWESTNAYGRREFSAAEFLFSEVPTSLWPLQVGKKSGFVEQNTWQPRGGSPRDFTAYWSCRVDGKEKVRVPAGEFDTWKIICARYSGSMRSSTAFAREYRTWYYAPEISHWVAMDRERSSGEERVFRRRELVAVMPSLEEIHLEESSKKSMQEFYQSILEKKASGQKSVWKTPNGQVAMTMTPTQTFRRKNQMVCRQYSQELEISGSKQLYYGVACRNKSGEWSVPRKGK